MALSGLLLAGCATDRHFSGEMGNLFSQTASEMGLPQRAPDRLPNRVAVLPFENATGVKEAPEIVRRSFYGHFALKSYRDVELHKVDAILRKNHLLDRLGFLGAPAADLGRSLEADGLVYGRITGFNRIFLGLYSRVSVEVDVRLVDAATGKVVWRKRDRENWHEGGIPMEPISAVPTLIRTALNVRDIQFVRATDDLCRSIVQDLPEPRVGQAGHRGQVPVKEGSMPMPGNEAAVPPDRLLDEAYRQLMSGGTDVAEALLRYVTAKAPENAEAHFLLGMCRYREERFDEALPHMIKSTILDPGNAGYHYNLGLVYAETGRFTESLAAFERTAALDPGHPGAARLIEYGKGRMPRPSHSIPETENHP